MGMKNNLAVVSFTAAAYYLLSVLNGALFDRLGFSLGVHWVFLPSGLRLAFVLIFVEWGALGVVLGSLAMVPQSYASEDYLAACGAAVVSGFAPWLARLVCMDKLKLDVNLENLTLSSLFKVAGVFSIMSPVLHQLWFTWNGSSDDFIANTVVMAVGDFSGTVVMLIAARLLLALFPDLGRH